MIIRCIKSFKYAFKGIYLLFTKENNAKVHLLAAIITVAAGMYFDLEKEEWLWVLAAIFIVFAAEAFNTAIEKLTDYVCPDFDPKAGTVKDIAAAGVLLTVFFAFSVGCVIFLPKIFKKFILPGIY